MNIVDVERLLLTLNQIRIGSILNKDFTQGRGRCGMSTQVHKTAINEMIHEMVLSLRPLQYTNRMLIAVKGVWKTKEGSSVNHPPTDSDTTNKSSD